MDICRRRARHAGGYGLEIEEFFETRMAILGAHNPRLFEVHHILASITGANIGSSDVGIFFMICYVLDVMPQTEIKPAEIVGAGFGAIGGLVLSPIFVYGLIPIIELPDITTAHPDGVVRAQENYNPENYFRD